MIWLFGHAHQKQFRSASHCASDIGRATSGSESRGVKS